VEVVVVDDVVAVEDDVVAVSGAGPLQLRRSTVSANEKVSIRVVDMIDSFTLGVFPRIEIPTRFYLRSSAEKLLSADDADEPR